MFPQCIFWYLRSFTLILSHRWVILEHLELSESYPILILTPPAGAPSWEPKPSHLRHLHSILRTIPTSIQITYRYRQDMVLMNVDWNFNAAIKLDDSSLPVAHGLVDVRTNLSAQDTEYIKHVLGRTYSHWYDSEEWWRTCDWRFFSDAWAFFFHACHFSPRSCNTR